MKPSARLSFCCTPLSLYQVFPCGWRGDVSKMTVSPTAVPASRDEDSLPGPDLKRVEFPRCQTVGMPFAVATPCLGLCMRMHKPCAFLMHLCITVTQLLKIPAVGGCVAGTPEEPAAPRTPNPWPSGRAGGFRPAGGRAAPRPHRCPGRAAAPA